jgi:Transposase, Mutator family
MLTVVPGEGSGHEGGKDGSPSLIDEIVREGARRMLAEALQAEVDAYIAQFIAERGENGRRLVVRNGCHQSRQVLTSAGAVEVTVPRVNDKRTDPATGERMRVHPGDLAAVGTEDPEGHRGAAVAVPARAVLWRLRARPRPVPGIGGWAVGGGDHPAHRDLAG